MQNEENLCIIANNLSNHLEQYQEDQIQYRNVESGWYINIPGRTMNKVSPSNEECHPIEFL